MIHTFRKNWRLYCCEALGLAFFMISACFFSAMLEGDTAWHNAVPNAMIRKVLIGILMGATALIIFYSPLTNPSGSQINPAVTLTFLRLGRMQKWDAVFYIIFQTASGTLAVFAMAIIVGKPLTSYPVNYAATVPAKSQQAAFLAEFSTAFVMMTMVLFTSAHQRLKKYTRLIAGCLVCLYVVVAGPVSGFGMNPARSLASAIPSNTWMAFWIYLFVPVAGMLSAAEVFLWVEKRKPKKKNVRLPKVRYGKQTFEIVND